jgi:hypothetical protein
MLEPEYTLTVTVDESPGSPLAVTENGGLSLGVVVPLTGVSSVTVGEIAPTVQDARAGVRSGAPDRLIARTSNTCGPSTSPV